MFQGMNMKTKTIALLAAAMLTIGASNVLAAESDNAVLNIKLHKIQSLVVNTAQKIVNLEYSTIGDYANGVTSSQKDHLEVFSTGGFIISAKASAATLNGATGNDKTIDVANVKLTASVGTGNKLSNLTMNKTALSNGLQNIVQSGGGGRELKFNVEYKTEHAADAYINHFRSNENPTVYTTTVTYTITPQ